MPRQLFAQYVEELITMRYEALRLNRALHQTRDHVKQARLLLAPVGQALAGLCHVTHGSAAAVQTAFATVLFEPICDDVSLVKHFQLKDVLSVRSGTVFPILYHLAVS